MSIDRFDSTVGLKVFVLTSPKAGTGAGREQIPQLVRLLREASVDCRVIEAVDDLKCSLEEHAGSCPCVVVAAGGDGTLSLAASKISALGLSSEHQPALIPMPMGTENLLARHFGLKRCAEQVCQTIRYGYLRAIDAGLANGELFLIMTTSGFDAEVVRRLHLNRTGHIGRHSYFRPILAALRAYRFPKLRIHIDDEPVPIECAWAMVFNLPKYGGHLLIEPDAKDNDGLFDVIALQGGSIASGFRYVIKIWLGLHLRDPTVVRKRGKSILIQSDQDVPFQMDGDYAAQLPLRIEMLPRSVSLLLPPKAEGQHR